jgi:hypothetical protein
MAFFSPRQRLFPRIPPIPVRDGRRLAAVRFLLFLNAAVLLVIMSGCSCVSTMERANLTTAASREEYVKLHPDGTHNDCIMNGEIVRGMSAPEVVASWGLPNVYIVTKTGPDEQWIFYVKDRDSLSMLIYTLGFADDTLRAWEVEQKRFVGQGIVSASERERETPGSTVVDPKKK